MGCLRTTDARPPRSGSRGRCELRSQHRRGRGSAIARRHACAFMPSRSRSVARRLRRSRWWSAPLSVTRGSFAPAALRRNSYVHGHAHDMDCDQTSLRVVGRRFNDSRCQRLWAASDPGVEACDGPRSQMGTECAWVLNSACSSGPRALVTSFHDQPLIAPFRRPRSDTTRRARRSQRCEVNRRVATGRRGSRRAAYL